MPIYVSDVELTIYAGRCNFHTKTWEKPRLTDGVKHPVKVIKVGTKKAGGKKYNGLFLRTNG